MKKVFVLVLSVLTVLCFISCTGPAGPEGATGPEGPNIPGLYFVRIFQQGVYSSTYSGQTQAALFNGMSGAYYTDAAGPVNLGYDTGGELYRAIFKFDLSSLPSSKIIVDKAEFTIKSNANISGGGAAGISVHKVTNSWIVFQAGWQKNTSLTGWTSLGGDFASNTMTSAASYSLPADSTLVITLDPVVVQDWMLNPSTNYGMLLKVSNESSVNYSEIYSSGAAVSSNRPMLKVWYYTTE